MNSVLLREATCAMVRHEAEEISPMMQATLSRSIMRSALVEAVCGLTESSLSNSTLRPIIPPEALISSTARSTAMTAYSPSGPRKPVRGVRWPTRMTSLPCARRIDGAANPDAKPKVPAVLRRLRRVKGLSLDMDAPPPCHDRTFDGLEASQA